MYVKRKSATGGRNVDLWPLEQRCKDAKQAFARSNQSAPEYVHRSASWSHGIYSRQILIHPGWGRPAWPAGLQILIRHPLHLMCVAKVMLKKGMHKERTTMCSLSNSEGPNRPPNIPKHCIRRGKMTTFSAAVFPPVLGPVMITDRTSGFTQMSTGTCSTRNLSWQDTANNTCGHAN